MVERYNLAVLCRPDPFGVDTPRREAHSLAAALSSRRPVAFGGAPRARVRAFRLKKEEK
jgi:hypothetical protein